MTGESGAIDQIGRLQAWYREQCDGDWEHQYGVQIGTLDNPGWCVDIDLKDTTLEGVPFPEVAIHRSEDDWVRCRVDGLVFKADGGPENLDELLRTFLDWADEKGRSR